MSITPAAVATLRDELLATVESTRPDLHRYCARLTGSVIEGEDIVQETLAKAFHALSSGRESVTETPALRPWLFRIAHNTALDWLKSHGHRLTEPRADLTDVAGFDDAPDPFVVRAALARFIGLPVSQRSAVILKDVLACSLEEAAETMGVSVLAVKAALVRGRAKLREEDVAETTVDRRAREDLARYAALFNARDWDGVRALVGEDCRLDLVSKAQRRGKEVGMYFGRYAQEQVTLRVVALEGALALAAHVEGAPEPAYFILLDWEDGRVRSIRDYRYVPYIARDAIFTDEEGLREPPFGVPRRD